MSLERRTNPARTLRLRLTGTGDAIAFGCISLAVGIFAAMSGVALAATALAVAGIDSRGTPVLVAFFLAFGVVTAWAMKRTVFARTEVGEDGLTFPGVFRSRFVSFREVDAILDSTDGADRRFLVFRLHDGKSMKLRIDALREPDRDVLMQRLQHAQERYREASGQDSLAILERGNRDVSAWRRALQNRFSSADYRAHPLTPEALHAVLENAAAPAEKRIGAALALSGSEQHDDRRRIVQAARASADGALRDALLSIAEERVEDDRILALLDNSQRVGRRPNRENAK